MREEWKDGIGKMADRANGLSRGLVALRTVGERVLQEVRWKSRRRLGLSTDINNDNVYWVSD